MQPVLVFRIAHLARQIEAQGADARIAPDPEAGSLFKFVFGEGIESVADIVEDRHPPVLVEVLFHLQVSHQQVLATDKSQVALRAVQTRAFDTTDINRTLRTVIATLQDLGFVVDKADDDLGTVSATKLSGYAMRMTVTVRSRGKSQTAVRASAQYNLSAVSDAKPYQQFFSALEKAMFLKANEVD